jgi:translocation and assembly module TamB
MARLWAIFWLIVLPMGAFAQTDGRDYLTSLIEDNLSTAGRKVTLTGFQGAMSSRAHLDSLTIADDLGVWISLTDVDLDWLRSDLLRGRLTVNTLTAKEIHLFRMPPSTDAPKAEAGSFALPSLPVAINIGTVLADKVILDAPVLGQSLQARITASLSLNGGQGAGNLTIERIDAGPKGAVNLALTYDNATRNLGLDVDVSEGAGGILAQVLRIPDAPEIDFTAKGQGALSDFVAKIDLASNGVSRFTGDVKLVAQGADTTGFSANLTGDMAPLIVPKYRDFFGNRVGVLVTGTYGPAGQIDISQLDVSAKALTLTGTLALAADGLPQRFALQGDIRDPLGNAVLLPLAEETRIGSAKITAGFDRDKGQDWSATFDVQNWDRRDLQMANLAVNATGKIARDGAARLFDAKLDFSAEGVQPASAAQSDALGTVLWGDAALRWREGDGVVTLSSARVNGDGYGLDISGNLGLLSEGFPATGKVQLHLDDLSRFARLMGRPLRGAANVDLSGSVTVLTGGFDLQGKIAGQDLALGISQLDGILQGSSQITLAARRDAGGIVLRQMQVTSLGLTADAKGLISAANTQLEGNIALNDLRAMGPSYRGALQGKLRYDGTLTDGLFDLKATADGLQIGQAQADRLMGGKSQLQAQIGLRAGKPRLDQLTLINPELSVTAKSAAADLSFDVTAALRNLGIILPEFPGALTVKGRITPEAALMSQQLDLKLQGPAGIDATVQGRLGATSDLRIIGKSQAALANAFITPRNLAGRLAFDLRLNGALAVTSLSGKLALQDGSYADPVLPFTVQGMTVTATLAKGRATVTADAGTSQGGNANLTGSIGLAKPYSSDLNLQFNAVKMRNPNLYDSSLDGSLQITGPLQGGALIAGTVQLGRTEIQVPSTNFTTAARLTGLTHIGDTAAIRQTRSYAYGSLTAPRTAPIAFGLDIRVTAPNRVFIRGRGLTAELAGEIQLRGTTLDVRPSGAFNLVQGRFEFLGKRLNLDEVLLQMEDQLIPTILIQATTQNNDVTSIVTIEGPAIDPELTLSSSPELPQEEVLAQLLFGQNIQNLSALQGVQLAGAVATLAGKGGDGLLGRLRKRLSLDDLDLQTDDTGATTLKAGKYVSDKVYTELAIRPNGKQEVNLNFAINPRLNAHMGVATDGNGSVGFVIQNNY